VDASAIEKDRAGLLDSGMFLLDVYSRLRGEAVLVTIAVDI
jgi:hypothetical protein